jgi:hypothetical protein
MTVTVAVVLVSMREGGEIWERGDGEVERMGKGDQERVDASKSFIDRRSTVLVSLRGLCIDKSNLTNKAMRWLTVAGGYQLIIVRSTQRAHPLQLRAMR